MRRTDEFVVDGSRDGLQQRKNEKRIVAMKNEIWVIRLLISCGRLPFQVVLLCARIAARVL